MHLTIDGFGGNPDLLANVKLVKALLDRYPEEIGMTPISQPHVFEYRGEKPEDWGVSGFVLIAESHIAIHTFPDHQQVWVDVFSCKGFDTDPAIAPIIEAFELQNHRVHKLERGLEYPHNVVDSIPVNHTEREQVAAGVK
ncbi:MAG TPA: S-adenosylmethionine decarboxylase [Candidatus Saccharimonadales bacterium]|nr:S-adenosylmethionine decarboxylase [Candidatus Saccharimonadales bacterium]